MKKEKKKRLNWFNRLVFVLNLLVIGALLLSYASSWISPENFWPLAFFGLAYPMIFFVNLLFVGYWLIFSRRHMLYSLFAILLGIGLIGRHVQTNKQLDEAKLDKHLKVMTYNVHSYARREWKEGEEKQFTNLFISFFKDQRPDILCLQEHLAYGESERIIREQLRQHAGLKHYYLKKYYNTFDKSQCIGIFSRYPIISYGKEQMDWHGKERTFFIYADLRMQEDTLRIYSVHLQSIELTQEHLMFSKNPKLQNKEYSEMVKRNSISMAKKLKYAFQSRARQADALRRHIDNSPYPVVVCGDFNDTPTSYAYAQLNRILEDAYRESGSGESRTYSGKFPSFRIDYIFYSDELKSANTEIMPREWSDHLPVVTNLRLKEKE